MYAISGALTQAATRLSVWIAAQPGDPDPTSGKDPEWGKAAPAGLLIWLFLGVALFLLIKSMNRHMRRVPKSFEAGEGGSAGLGEVGFDSAGFDAAGLTGAGGEQAAAGDGDRGRGNGGGPPPDGSAADG